MITMRLKQDWSRLERLQHRMNRNIGSGLEEIADHIIADVRANWSPVSPSVRGATPAVVSGRLDRSFLNQASNRDFLGRFVSKAMGKSYRVIEVRAPYSAVLEDKAGLNRPYLEPAVKRAANVFEGIMVKVVFK